MAFYVCNAQYPLDPVYDGEWRNDQLGLIYEYWTQYYIPCMNAHQYEIDTSTMPSKDRFIESFFTDARWWPADPSLGMSKDEAQKLLKICPFYPPDNIFYGTAG